MFATQVPAATQSEEIIKRQINIFFFTLYDLITKIDSVHAIPAKNTLASFEEYLKNYTQPAGVWQKSKAKMLNNLHYFEEQNTYTSIMDKASLATIVYLITNNGTLLLNNFNEYQQYILNIQAQVAEHYHNQGMLAANNLQESCIALFKHAIDVDRGVSEIWLAAHANLGMYYNNVAQNWVVTNHLKAIEYLEKSILLMQTAMRRYPERSGYIAIQFETTIGSLIIALNGKLSLEATDAQRISVARRIISLYELNSNPELSDYRRGCVHKNRQLISHIYLNQVISSSDLELQAQLALINESLSEYYKYELHHFDKVVDFSYLETYAFTLMNAILKIYQGCDHLVLLSLLNKTNGIMAKIPRATHLLPLFSHHGVFITTLISHLNNSSEKIFANKRYSAKEIANFYKDLIDNFEKIYPGCSAAQDQSLSQLLYQRYTAATIKSIRLEKNPQADNNIHAAKLCIGLMWRRTVYPQYQTKLFLESQYVIAEEISAYAAIFAEKYADYVNAKYFYRVAFQLLERLAAESKTDVTLAKLVALRTSFQHVAAEKIISRRNSSQFFRDDIKDLICMRDKISSNPQFMTTPVSQWHVISINLKLDKIRKQASAVCNEIIACLYDKLFKAHYFPKTGIATTELWDLYQTWINPVKEDKSDIAIRAAIDAIRLYCEDKENPLRNELLVMKSTLKDVLYAQDYRPDKLSISYSPSQTASTISQSPSASASISVSLLDSPQFSGIRSCRP